jgi:hypothetical protein
VRKKCKSCAVEDGLAIDSVCADVN